MAGYTTMFSSGQVHNQVKEFVVDTYDKIGLIDISQILPGSRTFVISDVNNDDASQWYMLNHQFAWVPVDWGSGGGSSADHVIYDGGEVEQSTGENIIYDGGGI